MVHQTLTTGLWKQVVKIADFGVSRNPSQDGDMTAETGTYRWMAPEVCWLLASVLSWEAHLTRSKALLHGRVHYYVFTCWHIPQLRCTSCRRWGRLLLSFNCCTCRLNNSMQKLSSESSSFCTSRDILYVHPAYKSCMSYYQVINHKPYDHRADIFSFAIVLWELVTSKVSHGAMSRFDSSWVIWATT